MEFIELGKIYRQSDFIQLLNAIRDNSTTAHDHYLTMKIIQRV